MTEGNMLKMARWFTPLLLLFLLVLPHQLKADNSLHEQIDHLITREMFGPVATRSTDGEFLRRLYLDLTGSIPPAEVAHRFLADSSPKKRAVLIDQLLGSPEYAQHMARVFDVMLMERRPDKHVSRDEWIQYLKTSFLENKHYNKLAQEILGADGTPENRGPVKFYLDRDGATNLLTREVGRIFFGRDLQCAQCHDHPNIDDYLQSEYYGLFAFLTRSYIFTPEKDKKKTLFAEKAEGEANFKSVFTRVAGSSRPRIPGGEPIADPEVSWDTLYQVKPEKNVRPIPHYSRREQLALKATNGDNTAFNRNIANRLWAHMMGRGLVHPVDLHHADNPATHPELLDVLSASLADLDFDIQAFLAEIALSESYQRSVEMPVSLKEHVLQATQTLPALQESLAQATSEEQAAFETLEPLRAELEATRNTVTELMGPYEKARGAVTTARKNADEAKKKQIDTKRDFQVKQEALLSITQASDKTAETVTKLPDDKPLAEVAKQLMAVQERLTQEVDTLRKSIVDLDVNVKTTQDELGTAQTAMLPLEPTMNKARRTMWAAEKLFDTAFQELSSRRAAISLLERRVANAQALVDYAKQETTLQSSLAAYHELEIQHQNALASTPTLESRLAQTQLSVVAAEESHASFVSRLNTAQDNYKKQVESVQLVIDAAEQAERAHQAFPNDESLSEASKKLKQRVTKYTAELEAETQRLNEKQTETAVAASQLEKKQSALRDSTSMLQKHQDQLQTLEARKQQTQQQTDSHQLELTRLHQQLTDRFTLQFVVRPLKPLSPEQLSWSMIQATGLWPRERTATETELNTKEPLKPEDLKDPAKVSERTDKIEQLTYEKLNKHVATFIKLFGAGAGQPQQDFFATVDQALFFSNSGQLQDWLSPGTGNLLERLKDMNDTDAVAREIYASVLTRTPSVTEVNDIHTYLTETPEDNRVSALKEIVWALLTSTEFRFHY